MSLRLATPRGVALPVALAVVVVLVLVLVASCSSFSESAGLDARDAGVMDVNDAADAFLPDAANARDWLYVFVSSQEHIGQFPPPPGGSSIDGFAGAAAFCKELADQSKFSELHALRWVAWLSADNQREAWRQLPRANGSTTLARAYRLRDGVTEVFPQGFLFELVAFGDGGTIAPQPRQSIVLDEQTASARPNLTVWSGTDRTMAPAMETCNAWNSVIDGGGPIGMVGSTSDPAQWSRAAAGAPPCSESHHVYCFEVPPP